MNTLIETLGLLFIALNLTAIFSIFIHMFYLASSCLFFVFFRNIDNFNILINTAASFYMEELGINREGVNIEISYKWPDLRFFGLVKGYVAPSRNNKYQIVLYLNSSNKSILTTLAHEMVHVKQHHIGDLSYSKGKKYWKGVDHSKTRYEKQPWEIEAFAKEEPLRSKFYKEVFKPM